MNSEDISKIIDAELSSYAYEEPEPGTTYGKPWTEEKVLSYIPKLKKALVKPYLQRFRLSESKEHFDSEVFADYWVVAIDGGYIQWFDPESKDSDWDSHELFMNYLQNCSRFPFYLHGVEPLCRFEPEKLAA